ncbi:MAG: phospholipase D family protein [Burkholderiaceae bacterium]|nr:phospholipase D family protein [Burkholderiaceae bacterium]
MLRLLWLGLWLPLCLSQFGGCALLAPGLPERPPQPPTELRIAPADSPLARLQQRSGVPAGRSAFQPMTLSSLSLQARLALIAQAHASLDLQTYLIGDDATGHQLMRALRDAAARGVRVRLLVDDLYTKGLTDLLLGLDAHDGIEVRLYNPFPAGRDSWLLRAFSLAGDFGQLNRRMHNKLFIADGRFAVVGGRNLADAYFMRSDEGNFIDFDLLCTGVVVPELGHHFDDFWNSRFAVPLRALADNGLPAGERRRSFEVLSRPGLAPLRSAALPAPPPPPPPPDEISGLLLPGTGPWVVADARVYFDSPEKTAGGATAPAGAQPSEALPVARLMSAAEREVIVVSPYFLPSGQGLERLQAARERGVRVQVITNSLVDSDEPLVAMAYGQRRMALVQAGVQLFEMSSQRLKRQPQLREVLAGSIGRLHAKLAFIDQRTLLVGSMNLDPRSASLNTELALAIHSPELVQQVLGQLQPMSGQGALDGLWEVRLAADGQRLEWLGRGERDDGADAERLSDEPAPPWWQRLKLWLLYLLVPDDLL